MTSLRWSVQLWNGPYSNTEGQTGQIGVICTGKVNFSANLLFSNNPSGRSLRCLSVGLDRVQGRTGLSLTLANSCRTIGSRSAGFWPIGDSVTVRLLVDEWKLRHNVSQIAALCAKHGLELTGVTKGFGSQPELVQAFVAGGAKVLADSRLDNLARLRDCGFELALLRSPALSEVPRVVGTVDLSFNTEVVVLKALNDQALNEGKRHRVILMIDLGEGREGIPPEEASWVAEQVLKMPGLGLSGIGANFTCLSGLPPTKAQLQALVELAREIRQHTGFNFPVVSGGNSSSLKLLEAGQIPPGITELRIGETILTGCYVPEGNPVPYLYQDVFTLQAEVVEVRPRRIVVALGWLDVAVDGLRPRQRGLQVVGATSDHLVLEPLETTSVQVGDFLSFSLNYEALARVAGARCSIQRTVDAEKEE